MSDYFDGPDWSELCDPKLVKKLERELRCKVEISDLVRVLDGWVETCRLLGSSIFVDTQEQRRHGIRSLKPAIQQCKQASRALSNIQTNELPLVVGHLVVSAIGDLQVLAERLQEEKKSLEQIPPIKGPHGLLPERHFFLCIAKYWHEATSAAPPIDREGRFYKFISLIMECLPLDCRPRDIKAETLKDWIAAYRKKGTGGEAVSN